MIAGPPLLPPGGEEIVTTGFNKFIGPFYRLPDSSDGGSRFGFIATARHMNAAGTVHGGMLATFLDVSMSRTARLASRAASCSTISLSCDFLAPGRLGDSIESYVKITRKARMIVFLSAQALVGDQLLVTAQGVWKLALAQ